MCVRIPKLSSDVTPAAFTLLLKNFSQRLVQFSHFPPIELTSWSGTIHAAKRSFGMPSQRLKNFPSIAMFILAACASAQSLCPVNEVIVSGRIDHLPRNADVRVQLFYAKDKPGESGDITPETERFRLPVDFLTQAREPIINGSFGRCGRRPIKVIVTLLDDERKRQYDCISLDFANDFKRIDSSRYVLKSDVRLKGPQ